MSKKKRPAPPQRQDVIVRWKNYFGAGDLEDWQRLCQDLGLDGEFGSKTKCRTALKSINVNIWDFLDAVEVGNIPQMFLTKKELVKYTTKTGRIFPRDEAKDMGPVAALRNVCASRVVLCETAQGPLCEDVTVVGALEPSSLFKKTLVVTDERLDAHGMIPHCLPHAI